MCNFRSMVISRDGMGYAETFCVEHSMPVVLVSAVGEPGLEPLCPIGRIEKACDEALKAIAEAQRIHWVDAVSTKDYKIG